jgi:hypothetical protein
MRSVGVRSFSTAKLTKGISCPMKQVCDLVLGICLGFGIWDLVLSGLGYCAILEIMQVVYERQH